MILLLVANDPKIMGRRTNSRFTNALGWLTALVMLVAAVALLATTAAGLVGR